MTDTTPLALPLSSVQLVQLDELPALQVVNEHAEALIALQGAQVLQYAACNEKPLIWLSEQAEFHRGQSVRGGIPVCWPWFGDLSRNPDAVRQAVQSPENQPAHGLVRAQDWVLESVSEDTEATRLTLRYPVPAGLLPDWNRDAELRLIISVGKRLKLELVTSNPGPATLHLSQALHTYFAISDIHQVRIQGLENTPFIDTLDQWQHRSEAHPIQPDGEIDRIYTDTPEDIHIEDPAWQRRIHVRAENSASAVVWNPWVDKSRRLSQFADDAWQRMLCIETANVLEDHVTLAPGQRHNLRVEIWSTSL